MSYSGQPGRSRDAGQGPECYVVDGLNGERRIHNFLNFSISCMNRIDVLRHPTKCDAIGIMLRAKVLRKRNKRERIFPRVGVFVKALCLNASLHDRKNIN